MSALGNPRAARAWAPRALIGALRGSSPAWAGYAAFVWALAYAVGVRGYQGLDGTLGLSGTFEDPAGMRQASLIAGLGIALVGFGELALVRPWGLRLPRWLVIIPALTGSAYAAAHALTAYVTKPLDALGLIWDLLFYEPWFLVLAALTTLGTVHHHRRTGGSLRAERRMLILVALATLAVTAYAYALVIVRNT